MTYETKIVTGRIRKPFFKKFTGFFWWWWMNDDDPEPPSWYHPEWSSLRRKLIWFGIRNPGHNFMFYVLGVEDRNYTVIGSAPIDETDRVEKGGTGWHWKCIKAGREIWLPRPYASYGNKTLSWHLGWLPSGAFGIRMILYA